MVSSLKSRPISLAISERSASWDIGAGSARLERADAHIPTEMRGRELEEIEIKRMMKNKYGVVLNKKKLAQIRHGVVWGDIAEDTLREVVEEEIVSEVINDLRDLAKEFISLLNIKKIDEGLELDDKEFLVDFLNRYSGSEDAKDKFKDECKNRNGILREYMELIFEYYSEFLCLFGNKEPVTEIFKRYIVDAEFINEFIECREVDYRMESVQCDVSDVVPYTHLGDRSVRKEVVDYYRDFIKHYKLNEIQLHSVNAIESNNENILVNTPTNTGKTLIAIMSIFKVIREKKAPRVFYTAPIKALIEEKCAELKRYFGDLTIIPVSSDHQDTRINRVKEAHICVGTPEKLDILTRAGCHYDLIVLDEIHILGSRRGTAIEAVVARCLQTRFLAMSATIPGVEHVMRFLRVKAENCIRANEASSNRWCYDSIQVSTLGDCFVAKKAMQLQAPLLLFVNERKQVYSLAKRIADISENNFTSVSNNDVEFSTDEGYSFLDRDLASFTQFGVGIHHAGLSIQDRLKVEVLFRWGKVRIIVCTSTLAWGLNLPCKSVIVYGTFPFIDILQMFGRASRGKDATGGECWYYGPSFDVPHSLPSFLLCDLQFHLNSEINLGTISSFKDALCWFSRTYCGTCLKSNIQKILLSSIHRMEDSGLIKNMSPTFISYLSHKFYIRPNGIAKIMNINKFYNESLILELIEDIMAADDPDWCREVKRHDPSRLLPYPTSSSVSTFIQMLLLCHKPDYEQRIFLQNILRILSGIFEYCVGLEYAVAYDVLGLIQSLQSVVDGRFDYEKGKWSGLVEAKLISCKVARNNNIVKLSIALSEPSSNRSWIFITDSTNTDLLHFQVLKWNASTDVFLRANNRFINLKVVQSEKTEKVCVKIPDDLSETATTTESEKESDIRLFSSVLTVIPSWLDYDLSDSLIFYEELSGLLDNDPEDNIFAYMNKSKKQDGNILLVLNFLELYPDNPLILSVLLRILLLQNSFDYISVQYAFNRKKYKINWSYFHEVPCYSIVEDKNEVVSVNLFQYRNIVARNAFYNLHTVNIKNIHHNFSLIGYNGKLEELLNSTKEEDVHRMVIQYALDGQSLKDITSLRDGSGKKNILRVAISVLIRQRVVNPSNLEELVGDLYSQNKGMTVEKYLKRNHKQKKDKLFHQALQRAIWSIVSLSVVNKRFKTAVNSCYLLNSIWELFYGTQMNQSIVLLRCSTNRENVTITLKEEPPTPFILLLLDEDFNSSILTLRKQGEYCVYWPYTGFMGTETSSKMLRVPPSDNAS